MNLLDPEHVLYFIQEGEDGPIKIGIARDGRERLRGMQVSNPRRLRIRALVDAPVRVEKELHRRLELYRISGEWFEPAAEVLEVLDDTIAAWGLAPCHECDREEAAREYDLWIAPRGHTCGKPLAELSARNEAQR